MKLLKSLAILALALFSQSIIAITNQERIAIQNQIWNLTNNELNARLIQLIGIRVQIQNNQESLIDDETNRNFGDPKLYLMCLDVIKWLRKNEPSAFRNIQNAGSKLKYDWSRNLYDPLPMNIIVTVVGPLGHTGMNSSFEWSYIIAHILNYNIMPLKQRRS